MTDTTSTQTGDMSGQLAGNVLFYGKPEPLSVENHGALGVSPTDRPYEFVAKSHIVPLTVTEFAPAALAYPVIFVGEQRQPVAVMGLRPDQNLFVENGLFKPDAYIPAYVRRYPWMLARLHPDAQELSLCFDPTTDTIGDFEDGDPLFENGQPSELTKNVLAFNEQFEQAAQRTSAFMQELKELDLLMEGEVTIQQDGNDQPFVYRGFQMVNEEKLAQLRGDQLRKISQSGLLPLVYAHLFSLSLMRDIFGRQVRQGKMPQPQLV